MSEGGATNTQLHRLAKAGDVKELKAYLKKAGRGAIDKKDEWDQTPLHIGCFEGHFAVVKYLVDNKKVRANVHARDKNNWTPLHAAASGLTADHVRICALLLDKGADPLAKTNDGSSPLHYFVRMDPKISPEFQKVLLRMATGGNEGTDKERPGVQPLRATPQTRKNVNAQNWHGESPLHHAATKGREQSAILLYQLGADVNLQNRFGETSLVVAIRAARPDMVRLLLSLGADSTLSSDAGTPMELAKSTGMEEIISTLIEFTHITTKDKEARKGDKSTLGDTRDGSSKDKSSSSDSTGGVGGFGFGFIVPTDEEEKGRTSSDSTDSASPRNGSNSNNYPDNNNSNHNNNNNKSESDPEAARRNDKAVTPSSVCTVCSSSCEPSESKLHYHFHARWPAAWEQARQHRRQHPHSNPSESAESAEQNKLSLDLCTMNLSHLGEDKAEQVYFVRALFHIPVTGASSSSSPQGTTVEDEGLTWGAWVKLNEDDFNWVVAAWKREGRETEEKAKEGITGELATRLPSYPRDTLGLPVQLTIRPVGLRPLGLVTAEHPLATQQRSGITRKKLLQLVSSLPVPNNNTRT